jgi:hypothetical protein
MGNFIHANQRRYQISTEMKDEGKGGEDRVKKNEGRTAKKKWKKRDPKKSGNTPKPGGIQRRTSPLGT